MELWICICIGTIRNGNTVASMSMPLCVYMYACACHTDTSYIHSLFRLDTVNKCTPYNSYSPTTKKSEHIVCKIINSFCEDLYCFEDKNIILSSKQSELMEKLSYQKFVKCIASCCVLIGKKSLNTWNSGMDRKNMDKNVEKSWKKVEINKNEYQNVMYSGLGSF